MLEITKKRLKNKDEMISSLQNDVIKKDKRISEQSTAIMRLQEQLKLALDRQFGKKSEKRPVDDPQAMLFDEADLPVDQKEIDEEEETITIPSHERKSKKGRKPLPENLPRIRKEYDLSAEEKVCDCGCEMRCIGETTSEQLDYIPARIQVIVHARKKYACKACESCMKEAAMPALPIPKSIATANLLSQVCISKFEDYLPLYRQERIFQRVGVDIPRATLANWVIKCADLLKPLYRLLHDRIVEGDVASADETRDQVLNEPNREAHKKSYMWCFSGGPPKEIAYLYKYSIERSSDIPFIFLEDFEGYLHADGYAGYDALVKKALAQNNKNISLVGCWYHVRRKFIEAEKVSEKEGLATEAIRMIRKLAKIEDKIKHLKPEGIKNARRKQAKPVILKFKAWLDKNIIHVPPQSILGKAMGYALNQWAKLLRYLEDGRLHISNNHTERAIKPFVIGRKNWIFCSSVKGAEAAAIIYSLIETCKAHKINASDYLAYAFENLPTADTLEKLELLLPFNVDPARIIR